ncbi:unnamed protein product, partial [Dovyalis caffra]
MVCDEVRNITHSIDGKSVSDVYHVTIYWIDAEESLVGRSIRARGANLDRLWMPEIKTAVYVPLGYRFNPTDSELACHYLYNKVMGFPLSCPHIVQDYDLYGQEEPWQVWDKFGRSNNDEDDDDDIDDDGAADPPNLNVLFAPIVAVGMVTTFALSILMELLGIAGDIATRIPT